MSSVAVIDQDGFVPVNAIAPPAAGPYVACERVVTAETFAVPLAPGSPVCNCTRKVAGCVHAVPPRKWSRIRLASPDTEIPIAIFSFPYSIVRSAGELASPPAARRALPQHRPKSELPRAAHCPRSPLQLLALNLNRPVILATASGRHMNRHVIGRPRSTTRQPNRRLGSGIRGLIDHQPRRRRRHRRHQCVARGKPRTPIKRVVKYRVRVLDELLQRHSFTYPPTRPLHRKSHNGHHFRWSSPPTT